MFETFEIETLVEFYGGKSGKKKIKPGTRSRMMVLPYGIKFWGDPEDPNDPFLVCPTSVGKSDHNFQSIDGIHYKIIPGTIKKDPQWPY